ncbi:tyrosine-type recombinase/integrase [Mycolicibacterium porcinum]
MAKRRAPGEGSFFQRKSDGLWVGVVELPPVDGERQQKRVTAKNKAEAKRKFDDLKDAVRDGLVVLTGATTVQKWLEHWVENIVKPKRTQSTYKFYEEAIRLHIVPVLGPRLKLDKLTSQHIYHVINSANTSRNAQRAHLVLNMALNKAVADRVLRFNVCASVDKPGHTKKEQDILEVKDAQKVIRTAIAMQEHPDYTGPLMATRWSGALWTGARPAELRGLEWDRINFDAAEFDLSWQLKQMTKEHGCGEPDPAGNYPCGKKRMSFCPNAHWVIAAGYEYRECQGSLLWTRPKTLAGKRMVPIVKPLLAMLEVHREQTKHWPNPHNLVWTHPDGRPIGEKQEWELWKQILDKAALPHVDQYATRHTTATMLDELGVSEDVRMQIMGHSSKVAHKAYQHVDQTRARAALEQLGELLS